MYKYIYIYYIYMRTCCPDKKNIWIISLDNSILALTATSEYKYMTFNFEEGHPKVELFCCFSQGSSYLQTQLQDGSRLTFSELFS